jgi:hypothetical protein
MMREKLNQEVRPQMTEAQRMRLEKKLYRLEVTFQQYQSDSTIEGIDLDIAMEQARECRTGRAQARDARQQLHRDFSRF